MTTEPAPIVVQASGNFRGDDGPWSTSSITIGGQDLELVASTEQSVTWAISPDACGSGTAKNCSEVRGGLFDPSKSSSWFRKTVYKLNEAGNLGYDTNSNNGTYGFDTLTLTGKSGVANISLDHQVIASTATSQFSLGSLGLSPAQVNFSNSEDSAPAYLSALKTKGDIPSLSWGYTAGAYYQGENGADASLTLGGYDSSKFTPNNVTFSLSNNPMQQLVVGLQQITYGDSKGDQKLLSQGIFALIDSTLPHMWLPADACSKFEDVFGLEWDSISNLYLVNDTTHSTLTKTNPTLTFSLADSATGGASVDITFPYAAFDLTAAPPLVKTQSRYFPLQRSPDDSSYTLGRTFLQEAYLITNYENSTFSVSQTVFDSSPSHLVPIAAAANSSSPTGTAAITKTTGNPTSSGSNGGGGGGISTGAIAGLAIAIAIVGIIVAIVAFFCIRKRRRARRDRVDRDAAIRDQAAQGQEPDSEKKGAGDEELEHFDPHDGPEAAAAAKKPTAGLFTSVDEVPETPQHHEMHGDQVFGVGTSRHPTELPGDRLSRSELGTPDPLQRQELPSPGEIARFHSLRSELSTPEPLYPNSELPTPDPSHELPSPSLSPTHPKSHPSPPMSAHNASAFNSPVLAAHNRLHPGSSAGSSPRNGPQRGISDDSIESPVLGQHDPSSFRSIAASTTAEPSHYDSTVSSPTSPASRPGMRRSLNNGRPNTLHQNGRLGSQDSDTFQTRLAEEASPGVSRFNTQRDRDAISIPSPPVSPEPTQQGIARRPVGAPPGTSGEEAKYEGEKVGLLSREQKGKFREDVEVDGSEHSEDSGRGYVKEKVEEIDRRSNE